MYRYMYFYLTNKLIDIYVLLGKNKLLKYFILNLLALFLKFHFFLYFLPNLIFSKFMCLIQVRQLSPVSDLGII